MMKRTTLALILCFIPFLFLFSQQHIDIFPNLEGEALSDSIVWAFKPTVVLNYANARDTLYSKIDRYEGKVTCIYSGHSVLLPDNIDPSLFLFMNGANDGINAEHAYPRSKGASEDSGNAFSDLHHIFPSRKEVNTGRSNFPFQEIPDSETTNWYYQNQSVDNIPNDSISFYSEKKEGAFEPAEKQKGNIARAIFYFYSMYQEHADEADPDFFESQRETLCNWHLIDPVDENEWNRTYKIAQYQDGKPNPFILDCSLALRNFCPQVTASCLGVSSNNNLNSNLVAVSIFPNPAQDYVNVQIQNDYGTDAKINVYSNIGRLLQSHHFDNLVHGQNTFRLPLSAKSMVVLEIVSGNSIFRRKVILID